MSDEMIQQQRTPSAAPYVVTGGLVAGGASAATGAWKPGWAYEKKTWDNLVEEMTQKDKAEFTKPLEGAAEEVTNRVNGYVDKAQSLAKEWDDAFNTYKAEHGNVVPELDENSQALKDLKAAQEKLDAKRAELEKAEADRIKAEGVKVEQPAAKVETTVNAEKPAKNRGTKYIEAKETEIEKLEGKIKETKDAIKAEKERMLELEKTFGKDAENKVAELQQEIEKLEALKAEKKYTEVYGGIEVKDVKTTKKVKTKGGKTATVTNRKSGLYPNSTNREIRLPHIDEQIAKQQQKINDLQQSFIKETAAKYNVDENKVKAYMEDLMAESTYNSRHTAEEIAQIKNDLNQLTKNRDPKTVLNGLEGTTDKALIEKYKLKPGEYVQNIISDNPNAEPKIRQSKLAKLENLKSKYKAFVDGTPKGEVDKVNEIFRLVVDGKPIDDAYIERVTPGKKAEEVVREFTEVLNDAEKKELKAIMAEGNDYGSAIDKAITDTKNKAAEIRRLNGELEAAGRKLELPNKKELKVHKTKRLGDLERTLAGQESELGKRKNRLEELKNGGNNATATEAKALTEEEIAAKAKEAAEKTLAESEEQKIFNNAKKVADDARANLPKVEAKADDVLMKEFVEKGGKGTREDFIKNGMKDLEKTGTEDLAKVMEKGKFNKGKFWGITAACVAAGMLLGKLIAPKKEQA